MSLPSQQDLNPMDGILSRRIKRWAARTHPPSDGQARLLWEAATWPQEKPIQPLDLLSRWFATDFPGKKPKMGPHDLIAYALVYSYQMNFVSVL